MKRDREEHDEQSEHRRLKVAKVEASDLPNPLESLLNLSDVQEIKAEADPTSSISPNDAITQRFNEIAEEIMHRYCLCIPTDTTEVRYEILELEFYLIMHGCHEDPFCHGSLEQESPARWYFHRAPTRSVSSSEAPTAAGGYRGGSRKGLDITFGGSTFSEEASDGPSQLKSVKKTRGGILLRTLRRISDKKVISGPSLLVDEVLKTCDSPSISDLVDRSWNGNIGAFQPKEVGRLSLVRRLPIEIATPPPIIHRSPRIGLDLSHPTVTASLSNPRVSYATRPYRYFAHPTLLTANGRPQTFAGLLVEALEKYGRTAGDGSSIVFTEADKAKAYVTLPPLGMQRSAFTLGLSKASGMKVQIVTTYTSHYEEAIKRPLKLESFIGPTGKGVSTSAQRFLQMIATLAILKRGPPA